MQAKLKPTPLELTRGVYLNKKKVKKKKWKKESYLKGCVQERIFCTLHIFQLEIKTFILMITAAIMSV